MKKFLSLVLALVMTMSLVTVGAGAKDFDDNADITYVEAVDVMSDLKIVDGDTAGNFNPTNGLTRGAAAKIICNLILGPTTAAELNADTDPFVDVDKDSVFAGYIAYCAKEGIVGGYADGTFKPAAPLTGYAFMKMLLGALGYDAAVEGYTGANWSINVAKQAIGIGLNADLVDNFNGSDFVTREEAMLYAFNTMKATMVDYDTTITIGDVTVAGSNEYDVANNARVETIYEDGKMQFAEKYFTKLALDDTTYDVFERPTNTWINGKETIGSYVDYTEIVAEYTTTVTGKELYDVVGKTAFNDYDFYSYVDGKYDDFTDEIAKNNKADIAQTGNGALTQVFVNNDEEYVVVTVINTYLAQAEGDYNAKKDTVSFNVFEKDAKGAAAYHIETVSGEDFDIADVKEDDFVLVTYAVEEDEIVEISEVEIVADTEIQKFKSGKAGNLTVDGETYSYNQTAAYDLAVLAEYTELKGATNLKDLTYNVYVDQYGYCIGVDLVTTPDNYLFITGVDTGLSNLSNKTAEANAIFMDGTSAVIDVNMIDSEGVTAGSLVNSWFAYTVDKNDVYTLALVDDKIESTTDVAQYQAKTDCAIDKNHIALAGAGASGAVYNRVYGNDATIYLLADVDVIAADTSRKDDAVIVGVDEVVTGVKNASFQVWSEDTAKKNITADNYSYGAYSLYKQNGYIIATVVVGESDTVASDLAYVISTSVSSESYDKAAGEWTWTRDVVIDGEKVELVETNDTGVSALKSADMSYGNWVTVKYDANGIVKKVEDYTKHKVDSIAAAVTKVEADDDLVVVDVDTQNEYTLVGSTLYDLTSGKLGFLVSEDVKVVLTQTNKNKSTTTYDEGVNVLEATLADLNELNTADSKDKGYYFDAVVVDGAATVVIIVDNNKDTAYVGPTGSNNSEYTAIVDTATMKVYVTGPSASADAVKATILAEAVYALESAGYMISSYDGAWTYTVTNALGGTSTFSLDYKQV